MGKRAFILLAVLLGALVLAWLSRRPQPSVWLIAVADGEALAPRLSADDPDRPPILSWLEHRHDESALFYAPILEGRLGDAMKVARGRGWFVNWADRPAVRITSDGLTIAHWLERSGKQPYAYGIRMALAADGGAFAPPFSPHPWLPSEFGFVSHLRWPDDTLGVVWLDGRALGEQAGEGAMQLRHAAFDRSGRLLREEVLDDRVCECCSTDALSTPQGPVVVYRGREEGEIRDIRLVRAREGRWQAPITVHPDRWRIAACPVNGPRITALGEGLAVAWFTAAEDRPRLLLAIAPTPEAPFAAPLEIAAGDDLLGRVALAAAPDGRLWVSYLREAGEAALIELRAYGPGGIERSRETLAKAAAGRRAGFPELAYHPREGLWAAWTVERDGRRAIELRRLSGP